VEPPSLPTWKPFEVDGRRLEWMAYPGTQVTQPAGWPSHKRYGGKPQKITVVVVKPEGGDDSKVPGYVLEGHFEATVDDAIEAARFFWDHLA